MARGSLVLATLLAGCGLPLLPTTLFYAPLDEGEAPDASSWSELIRASPASSGASSVVASAAIGGDEWLAWTARTTTDPARIEGQLVRARRTALGLEAQATGAHIGPAVRVTLRGLRVDRVVLVVVESSEGERSVERSAWLYVARGASITAATLDAGASRLPLHRETVARADGRWDRTRTVTATLEATRDALIVHEHATEREVARDHPEIPARAVREIDRDRRLVLDGVRLVADRASLFESE